MKKIVVAMLLLASITAVAQRDDMRERAHHMKDFSESQIATLQTKKLTLALDLSEEQQRKITPLLAGQIATRKAKMEAQKARKQSEEKITTDEKYAMQLARLDGEIAHKQQMKSLLTDTQYRKWEKMRYRSRKGSKPKSKAGRKG